MTEASKIAYVFPGQGAQQVGMGRDLYDSFESAKEVFIQADKILGFPLSKLCFKGPEDELKLTINAQPALVTVSLACLKVMQEITSDDHWLSPAFVAGHSLGEYTALATAGALDTATTIYLARERGRLMYEAGLINPGSMIAIIGLDETPLSEICNETGVKIANINCPGQLVISGTVENLGKAAALASAKGAKRTIPLQVSGAFHSPLIQPAVSGMAQALSNVSFSNPAIPVIANTTTQPITSAGVIKGELLDQLCNCVQWQGSVEYMIANGVTTFIEIGPGKVLSGLIKRINRDVNTININDVNSIRNIAI
ncbi:ACP S-malonyltransferase [Chloroflexota bacterium]